MIVAGITTPIQNILADVFASVSIILDKPYQIGDFIVVGDSMGTVERIGMKVEKLEARDPDPAARTDARIVQVEIALDDSARAAALSNLQVEVAIGSE